MRSILAVGLVAVALVAAAAAASRRLSGAAGTPPYAACPHTAQLAYVAASYSGQKGIVWLARADGSARQRLFAAVKPVLSPNGRMVAVRDFGGAGLGIFTVCGGRVGEYFSPRDAVSGVVWSPDSSLVAAVVDPHPKGSPFHQRLEVIDVTTGRTITVATGDLSFDGGPSFSPAAPYQLAYALTPRANAPTNVWMAAIGGRAVQLTHGRFDDFPLWAPQGILFDHQATRGPTRLELLTGGRSRPLMRANGWWPVAVSGNGRRLAAEGAACGAVWSLSVDLSAHRVVHQFPSDFPPYGISPSGGTLLVAGAPPAKDCGRTRSVIETVPFGGGRPTRIAYGTDPSWADSSAIDVQG